VIVLDTHVLVWWVAEPGKLSLRARRAVKTGVAARALVTSAISIFEIATLLRRGRLVLGTDTDRWFHALHALPELTVEPVSAEVASAAGACPDDFPGDPADRIIAATARVLGAKLVTADRSLRSAFADSTIW
jgi:PIN domain nuclease of toxin-antitoxin system